MKHHNNFRQKSLISYNRSKHQATATFLKGKYEDLLAVTGETVPFGLDSVVS